MELSSTNRQILRIAIPSIISNITVPLLGLIDVTIVGHLGSAAYIGAIAVGGMLFSMIYWIFGFLRMGTGGLTAQAYGAKNQPEMARILMRSVIISLLLAAALIILQYPIRMAAFTVIDASAEVQRLATQYFHICIWGAPATLALYSFNGWFIGMQNSRYPMYIAITQNIVNIAASLLFVLGMHMKVDGVALGTLIAQYSGFVMAVLLWLSHYSPLRIHMKRNGLFDAEAMRRFFTVNRDIFLRTICLVAVTTFFTSTGAAYGDVVLAVNTLLMQLFTLFSYIMDGFAYAGEALTGKCIGERNHTHLRSTVLLLFKWGIGLSAVFTLLYGIGGQGFLGLLTDDSTVISASSEYFYWVLAIPIAGFSAFLLDGICIGATATRIMLKAMIVASVSFFLVYFGTRSMLYNHALWMGFIVYLSLRGIMQAYWLRRLRIFERS